MEKITRYDFDISCGMQTPEIIDKMIKEMPEAVKYDKYSPSSNKSIIYVGFMSAISKKNIPIIKYLIRNKYDEIHGNENHMHETLLMEYDKFNITIDELCDKLIEFYDEKCDLTHGPIYIP